MIGESQVRNLIGSTAYDQSGEKIGRVGQVYYDDETNQPTWVTVHTGLFGTNETFVPVQGAELGGDRVTLAYDKATVKDAPNLAEDGHLSPQEEEQLYRHYGLGYGASGTTTTGTGTGRATSAETGVGTVSRDREGADDSVGRAVGRDTSGPTTDEAMTRSEEHLRVGTETREAGRARLRKHVVTEHQQATVPVSHEEVTLEREPITEANRGAAYDGPRSPRKNTKSPCTPNAPWSTPKPSRSSACDWARKPSPTSRPSAARSARKKSNSTRATPASATTRAADLDVDVTTAPDPGSPSGPVPSAPMPAGRVAG